MTNPDTSLAVGQHSIVDRARVPVLIAQYLPVEICIYYQVVPLALDTDSLILGMVDPQDLAALDYVSKMLAYSQISVEPIPITFEQQQDLIAYYFSHPPSPAEVEQLRLQAQASRVTREVPAPVAEPPSRLTPTQPLPARPTAPPLSVDESEETAQQLLNSMLRRALEEKAEQIFVEPQEGLVCRVRYRQQGILRDLFKDLSESIRAKLIAAMKRMMALDAGLIGEPQQRKQSGCIGGSRWCCNCASFPSAPRVARFPPPGKAPSSASARGDPPQVSARPKPPPRLRDCGFGPAGPSTAATTASCPQHHNREAEAIPHPPRQRLAPDDRNAGGHSGPSPDDRHPPAGLGKTQFRQLISYGHLDTGRATALLPQSLPVGIQKPLLLAPGVPFPRQPERLLPSGIPPATAPKSPRQ